MSALRQATLYSTTLLPGEQVRLFTSDRHSRFTFDSSSQLSYRHHNTSEESFYTAGMAHAMSDLNIVENENRSSSYSESSVSGGGSAGIDLGIVEIGGGVSGSSFDASSTSTLARSLSRHAEGSSRHVNPSARTGGVTAIPQAVLATQADRPEVERRARTSALESATGGQLALGAQIRTLAFASQAAAPISAAARKAALAEVERSSSRRSSSTGPAR